MFHPYNLDFGRVRQQELLAEARRVRMTPTPRIRRPWWLPSPWPDLVIAARVPS